MSNVLFIAIGLMLIYIGATDQLGYFSGLLDNPPKGNTDKKTDK